MENHRFRSETAYGALKTLTIEQALPIGK